jgi:hypothetical protein
VEKLLPIQPGNAARTEGPDRGKKWSAQQQWHFTEEIAFIGIEPRKLRWLSVNINHQSQLPLENHEETTGLAFSYEPFARFEPDICHGLHQSSAFGLVKTGEDLGLPQLFWSKHETCLKTGIDDRETLCDEILAMIACDR